MSLTILLEIGHDASIRSKASGRLTHDWEIFVKGQNGADIHYYVDRVVFHLHETFPNPKRVVKEPPYTLRESGYAGFKLPIEIYLKNNQEPKRIKFYYELYLQQTGPPIHIVQKEKYTFFNPSEEFRSKLLKGGAVEGGGNNHENSISRVTVLEKNQMTSKPKLSGSDIPKKHRMKMDEPRTTDFENLFGPPIKKTSKIPEVPKLKEPPKISNVDKPVDKDKVKSSKSAHKDKEKPKEKSLDSAEKKNKEERKKSKEEKSKDKERSKEKSLKKEKEREKSPLTRPRSPTPKRSPKRDLSPLPIPKHATNKEKEEKKDKDREKDKKEEKKSKKDKRDHNKEGKHKDRDRDKEHRDHKNKEGKSKEKDVKQKEASPLPVLSQNTHKTETKKPKEQPKEEEKPTEKTRNESEDRQKHKHKKKDRKEKKEDKHSKKEDKKQQNSITNAAKEPQVKEEKPIPVPLPSRQLDKSNLFGSPKSDSPSTPKEPEVKVESNVSFTRDDDSSDDSVKLSSKEASPAPRVPSKSPSPLPVPEPVKKPEPDKKKEQSPRKKEKKEKKKDKKIDKEKEEKRKKRKSDSTTTVEVEPPEKLNKLDELINSDEESKVSSTEDATPVVVPPKSECDMDMLRELQRKIMSLKDNADLQRVVQLIAETGQYEVSAHTFDFDLCLLDRSTVRQLQDFFSTIS